MLPPSGILSCWLALACPVIAAPVINEIMYRPGASYPENTGLEFIEIHNPDAQSVDISGWALTSGVTFTFPASTVIPAGGYRVVAANPSALMAATGLSGVLGPWDAGKTLSNSGESVTLSVPDGLGGFDEIERVRYADEGDWAVSTRDTLGGWSWITQANGGGCSVERVNPALATSHGQNWKVSAAVGGSPGAVNSRYSADAAPVISGASHFPAVPRSHQVVTISCQLIDELPAESLTATLFWRDASVIYPGPFQAVAMNGDGSGRFAATLGAKADKTIIEYYVQASDGTHSRTWPAPTSEGQNANALYQVDNEVESAAAATYRLVLTAAENAAYESVAATNWNSDRRFHLTFVARQGDETKVVHQTRMRIRGQSSRKYKYTPLRISLPTDDPWDGITDFSLNPKNPWVQFMGMRLIQASGLVGGDAVPVELRRNGTEYVTGTTNSGSTFPDYGMWVRIEQIDGNYADRHFPTAADVQLYRKNEGSTMWSSNFPAPTTPDGVYSGWSKQSQSSRNDWSDVMNFSSVWQSVSAPHFSNASPGNLASGTWNHTAFSDEEVATLSAVADLPQIARWLAVMTIMANEEHNISNGWDNDYGGAFVDDGSGNRRLQLIPHDVDNLIGKGENRSADPTVLGLFPMTEVDNQNEEGTDIFAPLLPLLGNNTIPGNPGFREMYLTEIRKLYGSVFDADTSGNPNPPFYVWLDNHLGSWVPATVRTQMKNFATARQAHLLGLIGQPKILSDTPTSNESFESTPATGNLRLNEILAVNTVTYSASSTFPDVIELHNTGATNIALAGHTIADSDNQYTFPAGSGTVPAGGYRIIHSNTLGFGISSGGDTIRLLNASDVVVDEISFGPQIADRTIARTSETTWSLCLPTLDAANGAALTCGPVSDLRLNEWVGNVRYRLSDDFIELYNLSALPVAMGGVRISDNIASYPSRFAFPPLSFIAPNAYLALTSDDLGFGLNGQFETVWFTGANGALIDRVDLIAQLSDTSTGRNPNGGNTWANFTVPSPGIANGASTTGYEDLLEGLRITEVMYAPTGGSDYEFIELQNIGTTPLNLAGVRFTNGINYTFAAGVTLAAGDYIVVCRNRTTFLGRYPGASGKLAAGAYTGSLDNSGETIALTLPVPWDINILRFRYEPDWVPSTAGSGRSLNALDQQVTHPADWELASEWIASAGTLGSPGSGEPPLITGPGAASGIAGDAFSYLITATRSPDSFGATGLPIGLTVDEETGLISGTPGQTGQFSVTLTATSSSGSVNKLLSLSIAPYGPFSHYAWEMAAGPYFAGQPIAMGISARDAGGRLIPEVAGSVGIQAASFSGDFDSPVSGLIPSPILITEVTDELEDQIELQNVSNRAVDTTGWTMVIGDSTTNINARNAATYSLPAAMSAGSLLRISDSNSAGRIYFGSIGWVHPSSKGHAR